MSEIFLDSSILPSEMGNFTIAIFDDTLLEGNEMFTIQLGISGQAQLMTKEINVTIADNESKGSLACLVPVTLHPLYMFLEPSGKNSVPSDSCLANRYSARGMVT